MALLRYEVSRSEVYRTLLKEIFKNNSVINLFLGKNSAAFVDSADQWTFDFDDLLSLPIEPVTVHIHDHHREHNPKLCTVSNDLKCGVTQGELLLHILEERYYMGRAGQKYTEAHLKCLSPGSYQNQYRKEMGLQSYVQQLINNCISNLIHLQWSNFDGHSWRRCRTPNQRPIHSFR